MENSETIRVKKKSLIPNKVENKPIKANVNTKKIIKKNYKLNLQQEVTKDNINEPVKKIKKVEKPNIRKKNQKEKFESNQKDKSESNQKDKSESGMDDKSESNQDDKSESNQEEEEKSQSNQEESSVKEEPIKQNNVNQYRRNPQMYANPLVVKPYNQNNNDDGLVNNQSMNQSHNEEKVWGILPNDVKCEFCMNQIKTKVEKKFNCCRCLYCGLASIIFPIAICQGGCSCTEDDCCNCNKICDCNCNDATHICPECGKVVGTYNACTRS